MTDYNANVVRKLDAHGNTVMVLGSADATVPVTLYSPNGIAVAPHDGRVYFTESSASARRVQVFDSQGAPLGPFGSDGTGPGQFKNPVAIAIDSTRELLYVADNGSTSRRIQKFDYDGALVPGFELTGTAAGPFVGLQDIVVEPAGTLLVMDATTGVTGVAKLHRFTADGTHVAPSMDIKPFIGTAKGLALDADGNILVADYGATKRVVRFSPSGARLDEWSAPGAWDVAIRPDGSAVTVNRANNRLDFWNRAAGGASLAFSAPAPSNTDGVFDLPASVAYGADGSLYVADTRNNRLQRLAPTGAHLSTVATYGFGPGVALSTPTAVVVEPAGTVLVSTKDTVVRYSAGLEYREHFGAGVVGEVAGIAVGPAGRVFVTDRLKNRVHVFEPDGTRVDYWPDDDTPSAEIGDLSAPQGIAFARDGTLWVAESGNRRLQRFTVSGDSLSIAQYHDNGTQLFSSPSGLALGDAGDVWVTDTGLHAVVRLNPSGTFEGLWGGRSGVGPNKFNAPGGIAVGPNGEILVADTGNSRLMRAVRPVVVDTTPPTIQVGGVPDGWTKGPVSVSLSALDEGTIPCEVLYSLDGSVPSIVSTGAVTISAEGTTTLRYSSRDAAGNEATGSAVIRIDKTGPVISHNAPEGWVDTAVDVSIAAVDALNDVAGIEYRYLPDGDWTEGTDFLVRGDGTHRIEVRATDAVGNQSSRIIELRINTSGIRVYAVGLDGWTTEPVMLTLLAEPSSPIYWGLGADEPINLYETPLLFDEEGVTTVNFAAERPQPPGGRTATNSALVCIDRTPPTVSDDAPSEVVRGPVTVTFGSDDGEGSGVRDTQYCLNGGDWQYGDTVLIAPEGATLVEYRAVDGVGLESAIGSCAVVIDNTPPTVSHEAPAGWVKGSAVVTLTADEGSILYSTDGSSPTTEYTAPLAISSQGPTLVRYRGRDAAGNLSTIQDVRVEVDKLGPMLMTNAVPAYEGTATVTISASDAHSGLKQMRYRVNGGEWRTSAVSPMVLDPIGAAGSYTVEYDALDVLDNQTSGRVTFEVREPAVPDTAPPVTTASGVPESWSRVPVTITLSADDDSDVQTLYRLGDRPEAIYVTPIPVSQDGETVFRFYSVDSENNVEDERLVTVRIDKGAPGVPGPAFVEELSATTAHIIWGPSLDPVSGVSHYVVTDETGRSLMTGQPSAHFTGLTPGSAKTFTILAVDFAGNVSEPRSLSVTLPGSEVSAPVASSASAVQVGLPVEMFAGEGRIGTAVVTLEGVTRSGSMTLSRFEMPEAPPPSKRMFGPGILLAFDGENVGRRAVTMPYDPRIPSKRASALTVMSRSGGQWQAVQSWVDTVHHTISFYPSSFGTFWVMEPATASTTAVISAPQTIKVGYGVSARITARLADANGEALVGYRVALERSSGTGWVRVGSMYPVSGTPGAYTLTQKPYQGTATTYRTVLEGTGLYAAASAGTVVIPKAKLTRPRTPTTGLRRYKAFYTTGTMAPAHQGRVKLYFERYSSGRWRVQKYVTVTASSSGAYRARTSLKAGKWRVRATHLDAGHLATSSAWSRTFTVR